MLETYAGVCLLSCTGVHFKTPLICSPIWSLPASAANYGMQCLLVTTTLDTWQSAPARLCFVFKKLTNILTRKKHCLGQYLWLLVHLPLTHGVGPGSYSLSVMLSPVCRSLSLYYIGNHFVSFPFLMWWSDFLFSTEPEQSLDQDWLSCLP